MKKNILKFLLAISFLNFTSCKLFFKDTFSTETPVKYELLKAKTTYKSFSDLQDSMVFTFPIFDEVDNLLGTVVIIFDSLNNEVFDWFFLESLEIYQKACVEVQPEKGGEVCYCLSGNGYNSFAIVEPSNNKPTLYPKTKDRIVSVFGATVPEKPKYVLMSNYSFDSDNGKGGILINTINTKTGDISKTIGFYGDGSSEGFVPDLEGNYWFCNTLEDSCSIIKINPETNSVDSPSYSINLADVLNDLGWTEDFYNSEDDIINNSFFDCRLICVTDSTFYLFEKLYNDIKEIGKNYILAVDRKTNAVKKIEENLLGELGCYSSWLLGFSQFSDKNMAIFQMIDYPKEEIYEGICIAEVDFNSSSTVSVIKDCIPTEDFQNFYVRGSKYYFVSQKYYENSINVTGFDVSAKTTFLDITISENDLVENK